MALNFKKILADSLIALCDEYPLSKISVRMITLHAGTGRQTFYNHFRDKNDLIYWIFVGTLSGEKKLMETRGLEAYLTKLYGEAKKYRRFLKEACLQDGQNSLSEAIYLQTYHYYKNFIISHYGEAVITSPMEFALQFNAHGASSLYIAWAKEGMPGSSSVQAQYAIECMPAIMRQYVT